MNKEENKIEKQELAKEGMKAISEIEESLKMEGIIKDNKIRFKIGEVNYRIRRPNYTEQEEIDTVRRKKYISFINDDSFLFRKQWIEKYNKRGIDINKMATRILTLQDEIKALLFRLSKTSDSPSIKKLNDEIKRLRNKQYNISIEKTDLLSYSIEDQLNVFVSSYTAYITLEKQHKEYWERAFENYEKFSSSNEQELIGKTFYFNNLLMYGDNSNVKDIEKAS